MFLLVFSLIYLTSSPAGLVNVMNKDEKISRIPRNLRVLFKYFEEYLDSTFSKISGLYSSNVDFLKVYLFYNINENFIKSVFKFSLTEDFGPILIFLNKGDKDILFDTLVDFASFTKNKFNLDNTPFWVIDFDELLDIESDRISSVKDISELFEGTSINAYRSLILASERNPLLDQIKPNRTFKLGNPEKQQVENALLKFKGILSESAVREATKVVLGQPSYVIVNHIIMALIS